MHPSSDPDRIRRLVAVLVFLLILLMSVAGPSLIRAAHAAPPDSSTGQPGEGVNAPVVDVHTGVETVGGSSTLEDTRTGTKTRLDSTVLFAKDSAALLPGGRSALDELAAALKGQGPGRVTITGYTDDLGSAEHGRQLSRQRAAAVADALRRHLTAKKYPMTIRGRGEKDPAVPNNSEAHRAKNRRVLVTLTRTRAALAAAQPRPTPTVPAATTTAEHPEPASPQPAPSTSVQATTSSAPTTAPVPSSDHTAAEHRDATPLAIPPAPPVPPTFDLTPLGRIALSMLLALAILGAGGARFGLRRRLHARRPAVNPSLAGGSESSAEVVVREQFMNEEVWTADDLDRTMRRLAGQTAAAGNRLPRVAAVEINRSTLTLHLIKAAHLAAPWRCEADATVWTSSRAEHGSTNSAVVRGVAPFPLLTTVGHTEQGAAWMLNLAELGTISVTGDSSRGRDFSRYLAADLATSPWATEVEIHCSGLAIEAASLSAHQFHDHVSLDQLSEAINEQPGRRTRVVLADTTTGAGVVSDSSVAAMGSDSAAVLLLADCAVADSYDLNLDGQGRLTLPGLDAHVDTVQLSDVEAAGCAALLASITGTAGGSRPATDKIWPTAEFTLDDDRKPSASQPLGVRAAMQPKPSPPADDRGACTAEHSRVEGGGRAAYDTALDADLASWFADDCDRPRLSLLGPVTVRAHGIPLARRKPYYVELLAYLALHPNGATPDELAEAFSLTIPRVRNDIKVLRDWLGTDRRTGRRHIPDARETAAALARGIGTYQVEGLLTDVQLFTQLRDRGESKGPDGILDLRRALDLVSGPPFDKLRPGGWAWLYEGDRTDQHLQQAIVGVAQQVARHYAAVGEFRISRRAAEIGVRAAPYDEAAQETLTAVSGEPQHAQRS